MNDDKTILQSTSAALRQLLRQASVRSIYLRKGNRVKLLPKYFLLTPLLVGLGGCQTIYEGKYDWDAGWRPGTVLEVGSAEQVIKEPFRDCRKDLSAAEKSAFKFAVVSYPFLSRPRKAVVPVSPASTWTAGNPVYINVRDCKIGLESRAVRAD